ncbi:MAG: hypothetical protein IKH15_09220 [Bacteroidales bacterium]|nr:hypothetical protein [Bacteroidales bacterium]
MNTVYYYKTKKTPFWIFSDRKFFKGRDGAMRVLRLLLACTDCIELRLDDPLDYIEIKRRFFDESYWAGRTPEMELNEVPHKR